MLGRPGQGWWPLDFGMSGAMGGKGQDGQANTQYGAAHTAEVGFAKEDGEQWKED